MKRLLAVLSLLALCAWVAAAQDERPGFAVARLAAFAKSVGAEWRIEEGSYIGWKCAVIDEVKGSKLGVGCYGGKTERYTLSTAVTEAINDYGEHLPSPFKVLLRGPAAQEKPLVTMGGDECPKGTFCMTDNRANLESRLAALEKQNAALEKRVAELEKASKPIVIPVTSSPVFCLATGTGQCVYCVKDGKELNCDGTPRVLHEKEKPAARQEKP